MTELILGVIGAVVGIIGMAVACLALMRDKKNDNKAEGEQTGSLFTEIGYIKAGIDTLKLDLREVRDDMQKLHDTVTRTEESCKQAHKRIDRLEKFHQPN